MLLVIKPYVQLSATFDTVPPPVSNAYVLKRFSDHVTQRVEATVETTVEAKKVNHFQQH